MLVLQVSRDFHAGFFYSFNVRFSFHSMFLSEQINSRVRSVHAAFRTQPTKQIDVEEQIPDFSIPAYSRPLILQLNNDMRSELGRLKGRWIKGSNKPKKRLPMETMGKDPSGGRRMSERGEWRCGIKPKENYSDNHWQLPFSCFPSHKIQCFLLVFCRFCTARKPPIFH